MYTIYQEWKDQLENVTDFIIYNNRLPCINIDKNYTEFKKLGYWCINQQNNYNSDINICKKIMKEPEIKCLWEDFMNMYPDLFYTPIEDWNRNLNDTIDFIIYNNRLPSIIDNKDNYKIEQLGYWVINQMMNYNSDIKKCKKRMKEPEIKYLWEELMDMYPYLFTNSMSY